MRVLLLLYTERGKVRSSDALKDEIARASALIAQHGSDQDCFVRFRVIHARLQHRFFLFAMRVYGQPGTCLQGYVSKCFLQI